MRQSFEAQKAPRDGALGGVLWLSRNRAFARQLAQSPIGHEPPVEVVIQFDSCGFS
jgi:hypothetical protein